VEFKNFEYQISSSGVGAYWRCLKVACKDSHLGLVVGMHSQRHSTLLVSLMMRFLIHGWEERNSDGMELRVEHE
jgi:hypothetical protein